MLEKMGEPGLIVFFIERANRDPQTNGDFTLRGRPFLDRIAHAIGQRAIGYSRVGLKVLIAILRKAGQWSNLGQCRLCR